MLDIHFNQREFDKSHINLVKKKELMIEIIIKIVSKIFKKKFGCKYNALQSTFCNSVLFSINKKS